MTRKSIPSNKSRKVRNGSNFDSYKPIYLEQKGWIYTVSSIIKKKVGSSCQSCWSMWPKDEQRKRERKTGSEKRDAPYIEKIHEEQCSLNSTPRIRVGITTTPHHQLIPRKLGHEFKELMLKFSINNKLEKWEIILAVDYIIRRGWNIH